MCALKISCRVGKAQRAHPTLLDQSGSHSLRTLYDHT